MIERTITLAEIMLTVADPDITWPSPGGEEHTARVYRRDHTQVVLSSDGKVVTAIDLRDASRPQSRRCGGPRLRAHSPFPSKELEHR
jgi:hypothetical protein